MWKWRRAILKQQRRTCLEKLKKKTRRRTSLNATRDETLTPHFIDTLCVDHQCRPWASDPLMAKDHTRYCVLVRGPHVGGKKNSSKWRIYPSKLLCNVYSIYIHVYIICRCDCGWGPTVQTLIGAVWDMLALVAGICERGARGTLTEGWPPSPDAKAKGGRGQQASRGHR